MGFVVEKEIKSGVRNFITLKGIVLFLCLLLKREVSRYI